MGSMKWKQGKKPYSTTKEEEEEEKSDTNSQERKYDFLMGIYFSEVH